MSMGGVGAMSMGVSGGTGTGSQKDTGLPGLVLSDHALQVTTLFPSSLLYTFPFLLHTLSVELCLDVNPVSLPSLSPWFNTLLLSPTTLIYLPHPIVPSSLLILQALHAQLSLTTNHHQR